MKKVLLLYVILCTSLNAQIGINKSIPVASVDLLTTTNITPLKIKNKDEQLNMEVNSLGDLFFKNTLLINDETLQNPGKSGEVLVSNGPNKAPSWVKLEDSIIGNYLTSIVNAGFNLTGPILYTKSANTIYSLSYLDSEVTFIPGYAVPYLDQNLDPTAEGTNYLSIEKEGVYSVVVNGFIESSSLSNVRSFECTLHLGDYEQPSSGYLNNDRIQFLVEGSRYLRRGDRIYLTLSGPDSWGFKEFNVLVNYVKADN